MSIELIELGSGLGLGYQNLLQCRQGKGRAW
jgi:hypothetical protein